MTRRLAACAYRDVTLLPVRAGMSGSVVDKLRLVLLRRRRLRIANFGIIAATRGVVRTMINAELVETERVIHWRRWRFADPAAAAAVVLAAADGPAPPQ